MEYNNLGIVNNKIMVNSKSSNKYVCQAMKDISERKTKERKEILGEIEKRE